MPTRLDDDCCAAEGTPGLVRTGGIFAAYAERRTRDLTAPAGAPSDGAVNWASDLPNARVTFFLTRSRPGRRIDDTLPSATTRPWFGVEPKPESA